MTECTYISTVASTASTTNNLGGGIYATTIPSSSIHPAEEQLHLTRTPLSVPPSFAASTFTICGEHNVSVEPSTPQSIISSIKYFACSRVTLSSRIHHAAHQCSRLSFCHSYISPPLSLSLCHSYTFVRRLTTIAHQVNKSSRRSRDKTQCLAV